LLLLGSRVPSSDHTISLGDGLAACLQALSVATYDAGVAHTQGCPACGAQAPQGLSRGISSFPTHRTGRTLCPVPSGGGGASSGPEGLSANPPLGAKALNQLV
jgi:hypothetical protein